MGVISNFSPKVVLLALSICALAVSGTDVKPGQSQFAILIAGSKSFSNYRHQADISHSYHILLRRGIPAENIITFMFNDVVNDWKNVFKGSLYNWPRPSTDVYKGVRIDYAGADVNARMLRKVLMGDATLAKQGRRVLNSTKDDNVFFYFSDHGTSGFLCLPSELVGTSYWMALLEEMYKAQKYEKMVMLIEACLAGSIFEGVLPSNLPVIAITAADAHESSYGCFYDDVLQTSLGDLFSVVWMHFAETVRLSQISLYQFYRLVKRSVQASHVQIYGDYKGEFGSMTMDNFMGPNDLVSNLTESSSAPLDLQNITVVPNMEVGLLQLTRQYETSLKDGHDRIGRRDTILHQMLVVLSKRKLVRDSFDLILATVGQEDSLSRIILTGYHKKGLRSPISLTDNCYMDAVQTYSNACVSPMDVPQVSEHVHELNTVCHYKLVTSQRLQEIITTTCQSLVGPLKDYLQ